MSLVHYCFVRRDLPVGVMGAMLVHAAGDSASTRMWPLPPHTIAVVLEAKNEVHLREIRDYLISNGIEYLPIIENSAPYEGQLMALGLIPIERDKVSGKLRDFQTLKSCGLEEPNVPSPL